MGAVEYSGVVRKSRGLLIYKCNYNYWKVADRSFQSGGGEGTLAIAGSLLPFLLTRKDAEFESPDTKKQARGSTSTKRSRAAEVHNLSERRRRDRINEKMKALQELIPRCNKTDKASMLDEAIEYLKSLQLQVQMMSMGCGMVPMVYPGMQLYMPSMGMGMGMGMGMEIGMNRPMVPYPPLLPGAVMQNAAAAAQIGPRFPIPPFHLPPVPVPDPSRMQASSQPDPMLNPLVAHNSNQPRLSNFNDPYQQFFGLQQVQVALPQNQTVEQPSNNKSGSSKEVGNPENHQSGQLPGGQNI